MHQQQDCVFCQIVSGEGHCHLIHEDSLTMTFLDIFPSSPGHTLIITKQPFTDIFEVTPDALAAVAARSVAVAAALNDQLKPAGLGIFQLNKAAAGQTVFHYHMHLIPKYDGIDFNIHAQTLADPATLSELANQLRECLS